MLSYNGDPQQRDFCVPSNERFFDENNLCFFLECLSWLVLYCCRIAVPTTQFDIVLWVNSFELHQISFFLVKKPRFVLSEHFGGWKKEKEKINETFHKKDKTVCTLYQSTNKHNPPFHPNSLLMYKKHISTTIVAFVSFFSQKNVWDGLCFKFCCRNSVGLKCGGPCCFLLKKQEVTGSFSPAGVSTDSHWSQNNYVYIQVFLWCVVKVT